MNGLIDIGEVKDRDDFTPDPYGMIAARRVYRFSNGYGASVIQGEVTMGAPFELAVVAFSQPDGWDFKLTYDTAITNDVERGNTDEINGMLRAIEALPPKG